MSVRRTRTLYRPVRTLALLPIRSPTDAAQSVIAVAVDVDLCEQRLPKPLTTVAAPVELDILRNPRRMTTGGSRSDSGLVARPGPVKPRSSAASGFRVSPAGFAAQFHHCRGEDHPEPGPRRRQDRSADRLPAPVGHRQPACLGLLPGRRIRRDRPGRNCVRHRSAHVPRPNPKLTPPCWRTTLAASDHSAAPKAPNTRRQPACIRILWR